MDVKKLALLVGALVIAVITAVMAKNMFAGAGAQQAAAAPAVPVGPKVLVAKKALPVGTIIDADSFTFQPWPKELMQGAYYVEGQPDGDPKKLLGTVVRYPITAGQPVTRGCARRPAGPRLPRRGARRWNACHHRSRERRSGVAGFVFPGDHVDLVLTQQVEGGGDGPALKVSETIIRNLRVLATDQRITDKDEDGKTAGQDLLQRHARGHPRIAEKIAVAQSLGSLSLSLRSIADNTSELERAVASGDIKVPAGTNPEQEKQMLLAIANRPIDSNTTFSTGGDVSRFQRRTVPAQAKRRSCQHGAARQGSRPGACRPRLHPTGPVVRIARGNDVTVVPVGAR